MLFQNASRIARALVVLGAVCLAAEAQAVTLLSENFDSLPLKDSVSPTEQAGTAVWTDVAPDGWVRDNSTTPIGNPVEFQGWTFVNKDWWVRTAGDQNRSSFAAGQNTVAVADGDEYDDGTNVDPDQFNVFLKTRPVSMAGHKANSVNISFDSSFRVEGNQTGTVDVAFVCGGCLDPNPTFTNVFKYDSTALTDGETINTRVSIDVNNPAGVGVGAPEMIVRFGNTRGGNNWWWAVDNVAITAQVVPEPSSFVLASLMGLGLLKARRRS